MEDGYRIELLHMQTGLYYPSAIVEEIPFL
jgi:hypothetical protein